jgi:hypothetical protein
MFILSRKSQESVVVGASDGFEPMLKVTVLETKARKSGLQADSATNQKGDGWRKASDGQGPANQPLPALVSPTSR